MLCPAVIRPACLHGISNLDSISIFILNPLMRKNLFWPHDINNYLLAPNSSCSVCTSWLLILAKQPYAASHGASCMAFDQRRMSRKENLGRLAHSKSASSPNPEQPDKHGEFMWLRTIGYLIRCCVRVCAVPLKALSAPGISDDRLCTNLDLSLMFFMASTSKVGHCQASKCAALSYQTLWKTSANCWFLAN